MTTQTAPRKRAPAPRTATEPRPTPIPGTNAPTRAEIREAIAERVRHAIAMVEPFLGSPLDPILDSDSALTRRGWQDGFYPPADHPGTLWADLTQDEARELTEAVNAAVLDAEREMTERVIDAAVNAAVRFAERHPDAPRGRWKASES